MKHRSSMVIGGIDAYTFIIQVMNLIAYVVRHLTFIKQIWYMYIHMAGYSLHTLHVTETLSRNGTRKFSTLFTNLHKLTYEK